jgi:Icc protein
MTATKALKILHITDLHLHADPARELYGVRTDQSFRAVVERALGDQKWRPDAVLVTGDIVEDCSREGYQRFRSILEPLGVPVLCLPGNHDDPARMTQQLNDGAFSFCSSRDLGVWRFVLLNSHIHGEESGELSDTEFQRLEQALANAGDRFVFVAVHHQPVPVGSAWLDDYGLRNGDELLAMLKRHGNARAIIWGHVHQAIDRRHAHLRMLCTPSTCAQFTPLTEECVMDTRPPAFRRLTLDADGNISTEVRWLDDWSVAGRPPDSRISEASNDDV